MLCPKMTREMWEDDLYGQTHEKGERIMPKLTRIGKNVITVVLTTAVLASAYYLFAVTERYRAMTQGYIMQCQQALQPKGE